MISTRKKLDSAFASLKGAFGYKNSMAVPRIVKVVVSIGTGRVTDKNKITVIIDRLARITGQKVSPRPAKQSIAGFKSREGDIIGYKVTLRGKRANDFLDRFLNIALPRTRDFRGVKESMVDEMGNITIGILEHTIFPETADEELKDIFGLAMTIVTTAQGRDEALGFFKHIGVPFRSVKK